MISSEITVLAGTAASLGLIHTILGPDHHVPFIVMSQADHVCPTAVLG